MKQMNMFGNESNTAIKLCQVRDGCIGTGNLICNHKIMFGSVGCGKLMCSNHLADFEETEKSCK